MLRNETDYDDWDYGTEPIPCDTSWIEPLTLDQLLRQVAQVLSEAETLNTDVLARKAITAVLKLPLNTLQNLKNQDP